MKKIYRSAILKSVYILGAIAQILLVYVACYGDREMGTLLLVIIILLNQWSNFYDLKYGVKDAKDKM